MTREEALNAITAFIENYAYGNDLIGLKMAIEALKERPHGKWIFKNGKYRCTACGEKAIYVYSGMSNIPKEIITDFCPKCGADMRKEGDEK